MQLIKRIRNNSMEETFGVASVPATASSGEKARPRVADESSVEERKVAAENPLNLGLKSLQKRSQVVTTDLKHKNEPFQGRIMQERHRNRRRRGMRGTILAIWRTRVGFYRPTSF
jgi:hypothetical protein